MNALHRSTLSAIAVALAIAAPVTAAQAANSGSAARNDTSVAVTSAARPDAKPIEDMQLAAQRLRDAIHNLVKEPAGPTRARLIREGDRALAEVESAMANLPPDLLTAEATESSYRDSSDELQRATRDLHEATQALAFDQDSKRRNETLMKIRTASMEIRHLLHDIPGGTQQN